MAKINVKKTYNLEGLEDDDLNVLAEALRQYKSHVGPSSWDYGNAERLLILMEGAKEVQG